MKEQTITLQNASGLHARPAKNFVQTAKQFSSNVTLVKADGSAFNGKSLMKILQAGLSQGDVLTVRVEGDDEVQALEAVAAYLRDLDE